VLCLQGFPVGQEAVGREKSAGEITARTT